MGEYPKKILMVSSYPPRECGIATFTKNLCDALQKKFGMILVPKVFCINEDSHILRDYDKRVIGSFVEQELESYEKAAKKINKMQNIGLVNIQHEFGLFGGKFGSHLLRFMELTNKKMITTMHTVLKNPKSEMKQVVRGISEYSEKIVVMTNTAKELLEKNYKIDGSKIEVIYHGVPSMVFQNKEKLRRKYGLADKKVLLTFGLLSKGKGVENIILAMPKILEKHPNAIYLVLGETHPKVRKIFGEEYRDYLKSLVQENNLIGKVKFIDKFLSLNEIIEFLELCDVYVAPALDKNQICSGTVSYAMGAGKPIVASFTRYNKEMLAENRGIVVRQNKPGYFANAICKFLDNQQMSLNFSKNVFEFSRKMTWPNVANSYFGMLKEISNIEDCSFGRLPPLNFKHFYKLTDDFGIIQFCNYSEPDINSGYTLDDNARALVVAADTYSKFGSKKMLRLSNIFLNFLDYCQMQDGKFHNFVDENREFLDDVGSEDSQGRAIWALGHVLDSNLPDELKLKAKHMLEKTIDFGLELESTRAEAYSLIGLSQVNGMFGNGMREKLVESLISKYNEVSNVDWNWFEESLTYANGSIPEALFIADNYDKTGLALKVAEESLNFLTKTLFIGGKLVPIGQEKWFVKDLERSHFDQQPIEASVMTTAYIRAFQKTGNKEYAIKARSSFDWYLGKNTSNLMVYDEATGGCFDGLTKNGVNANEGAEATVTYLLARMMISKIL
ncbi:MAG: glycosyltransferase family 4 protein [Candidatus Diapherotrites archaeon]